MNNTIDFNTAKTIGTMSKKIDHIDDTVSGFFSFMHMVMQNELGNAEPYFAAVSPVLDLTVIRPDDAPHILPCFDEADEGIGIHNLKQAAKTLTIYQQYGFSSPEQLEAAVATAYQEMRQTSGELKALETKLQGKRELRQQVLAYAKTKPIREGLKAQKSEKARAAYRQANESDFIIAEAAARYFKAQGLTKLPGRKALQAEIEQLISEKDGLYNTYHEQKQRFRELQTVKRNIDQILRREEPHRRKEQSHER